MADLLRKENVVQGGTWRCGCCDEINAGDRKGGCVLCFAPGDATPTKEPQPTTQQSTVITRAPVSAYKTAVSHDRTQNGMLTDASFTAPERVAAVIATHCEHTECPVHIQCPV
jgi:hypothetical protein